MVIGIAHPEPPPPGISGPDPEDLAEPVRLRGDDGGLGVVAGRGQDRRPRLGPAREDPGESGQARPDPPVLLGLGVQAKVFIVFLGASMPILLNTYAGVLASNAELVEMAKSVGASRWRVFSRITLPGALPFIVVGLRVGATIGLINTVVAELYTAVRGLGGLLAVYGNTFRMAEYFVIVLILAAIGVTVTGFTYPATSVGRPIATGSNPVCPVHRIAAASSFGGV